jgi:hypothetical protein
MRINSPKETHFPLKELPSEYESRALCYVSNGLKYELCFESENSQTNSSLRSLSLNCPQDFNTTNFNSTRTGGFLSSILNLFGFNKNNIDSNSCQLQFNQFGYLLSPFEIEPVPVTFPLAGMRTSMEKSETLSIPGSIVTKPCPSAMLGSVVPSIRSDVPSVGSGIPSVLSASAFLTLPPG